ncbi:MAG UNVERIFIED_CONTAM: hypothetical protein LOD86_16430, partial [Thermobifida fusca]
GLPDPQQPDRQLRRDHQQRADLARPRRDARVVRTGRVDRDFGQAEVTAADGSTALIQVRQTGEESLTAGSTALIVDYDPEGSFFWVTAYHAELDPHRS